MSIMEWIILYLVIGAIWSWFTNAYEGHETNRHDFVLSAAIWPTEVLIVLIATIPIAWEEARDKVDEWKAKRKK